MTAISLNTSLIAIFFQSLSKHFKPFMEMKKEKERQLHRKEKKAVKEKLLIGEDWGGGSKRG